MSSNNLLKKDPEKLKEAILENYPAKVAKKRSKAIVVNKSNGSVPEIQANVRTIPGMISQRGCAYAGCKGVVLGPTRDILNITHGPVGCSFYSWGTRRNQTKTETPEEQNFIPYAFTTDMREEDIVFGGEKKLTQAIQEAYDIFKPKAIAIHATCPVGLIGDDIHAVARKKSEELGISIFAFSCEGYKGVSQSAGHHIANNGLFTHVVGKDDTVDDSFFKVNLLGEYNIGGDAFELERIFKMAGINLISTYSGNSTFNQMQRSHTADLNLVMCHRSINYLAEMMEKKYGIPWLKINFIGAQATAKSLRKMAKYFEDAALEKTVEEIIAKEMQEVEKVKQEVLPRTQGKTAMLFVGGSRAHHYQELFAELGMKTLSAGYEFAHRDDYEGREVIPKIKVDADTRNIEELEIEEDAKRFKPRKSKETLEALKSDGLDFSEYTGMMQDMENETLVVDDITHFETEKLLEVYKPDIFCAGIKEKYVIQKHGIPLKQLHSYDYGGPYAGFKGAINFYKEIDRMVNSKVWGLIDAPWDKNPQLLASYAFEA